MIDLSTNDQPLQDAVRAMGDRTPVGSLLSSDEWSQMPLALRQRAQFSAKIESMRVLDRIQQRLMETVREQRRQMDGGGEGSVNTRQNFINDVRQIMADEGIRSPDGKQGTVQDPTSVARLGLIFDQQTGQAYGYAGWKNGMDPDLLDAYPAQELVRVSRRKVPRNWVARWRAAGGRVFDGGRLIALKTDPIWEAISRFGSPWPPFDYGSGMGLRDVGRREAETLGLLTPGQRVKPNDLDFNDRLQAQARLIQQDPDWKDWLETAFGDQVRIAGDVIKWTGGRTSLLEAMDVRVPPGQPLRELLQRSVDVMDDLIRIPAGQESDTIVPIGDQVSRADAGGEYYASADAPKMEMNPLVRATGETLVDLAHETGHYVDHHLLGAGEENTGWASEFSPELAPLLGAIERSDLFQRVLPAQRAAAVAAGDDDALETVDYLLQGRESFARAFAQWVADRSGHPEMRADIAARLTLHPTQVGQWTEADFGPVGAALDDLFGRKGWLTK